MHSLFLGYTKLLVGLGYRYGVDIINSIEIIDLNMPSHTCDNLAPFPKSLVGAVGGLSKNNWPFLCGGYGSGGPLSAYWDECYSFEDFQWTKISSMTTRRVSASFSPSPFSNSDTLFVAGGQNEIGALNSGEIFKNDSWHALNSALPVYVSNHCMVLVNSTTVLLIGGQQNGNGHSSETYFLNAEDETWTNGPGLKTGRELFSCAKIKKSHQSSEYVVIIAGGQSNNESELSSVEVLEDGASEWVDGPELPVGLYDHKFVEDSNGGVILVGGLYTDKLYHLAHAKAEWVEMPQKLKTGRQACTAFLVPDEITTCH